jgi:hypothetical protein
MPVLYKPNFCCHCGEAIDRLDWKIWTSRRFCDVCETEQKQYDLLPRFILGMGLLAGLFGISGFMAKPAQQSAKSQTIATAKPAVVGSSRSLGSVGATNTARDLRPTPSNAMPPPQNVIGKVKPVEPERVYFCGAATKKGSPCSRRVKSPGRCWQHAGQPAAVVDETVARGK